MPKAMTDSEISIRRAELDEVEILRHLHVASLCCGGMRDSSAEDVDAFLRAFPGVDQDLVSSGRYFVSEVAGHVVAGGGWSATREACPSDLPLAGRACLNDILPDDSAMIRGFFVHEGAVGTGVARSLMRWIERDAAEAGHAIAIMVASRVSAMACGDPYYRDIRPLPLLVDGERVLQLLQLSKRIGASYAAVA